MNTNQQPNQANLANDANNLVKPLEKKSKSKPKLKTLALVAGFLVVASLGVLTGYLLTGGSSASKAKKGKSLGPSGGNVEIKSGLVVGVQDEDTFSDFAQGTLKSGGIDGEGSHHLERPGGESQNVYLTSSVIDLNEYVEQNVKVWGETFAGQKAGWLMDVGRLEVL